MEMETESIKAARSHLSFQEVVEITAAHYHLQNGCYFSNLYRTDAALFTYCSRLADFIWNHIAFVHLAPNQVDEFLLRAARFFNTHKRKPCFYIGPLSSPSPVFLERLLEMGYTNPDTEAWMLYTKDRVVQAQANLELDISCFSPPTDRKTIGNFAYVVEQIWPGYGKPIRYENYHFMPHKDIFHYTAKWEDKIVGIGSLYSSGKFAVLHNIATVPHYSKQGIGSTIVARIVSDALKNQHRYIFLQCEQGGDIEQFYATRGFETFLVRAGMVLQGN